MQVEVHPWRSVERWMCAEARIFLSCCGIIACFLIAAILVGRAMPVTYTTYHRYVDVRLTPPAPPAKIVYKDKIVEKPVERIVYKDLPNWMKPVDPKAVCEGSMPVQIIHMDVSTKDKDNSATWIKAEVVGRGILVTCQIDGDMNNFWKEGDIIQIKQGKAW